MNAKAANAQRKTQRKPRELQLETSVEAKYKEMREDQDTILHDIHCTCRPKECRNIEGQKMTIVFLNFISVVLLNYLLEKK